LALFLQPLFGPKCPILGGPDKFPQHNLCFVKAVLRSSLLPGIQIAPFPRVLKLGQREVVLHNSRLLGMLRFKKIRFMELRRVKPNA